MTRGETSAVLAELADTIGCDRCVTLARKIRVVRGEVANAGVRMVRAKRVETGRAIAADREKVVASLERLVDDAAQHLAETPHDTRPVDVAAVRAAVPTAPALPACARCGRRVAHDVTGDPVPHRLPKSLQAPGRGVVCRPRVRLSELPPVVIQ